ncbi:MAG: FKBP-type peptidyl-prolyl cis-trans isomerase [Bacteroidetes bacterium]|nr:FKBP-type peptidyl-prolyl cis-trans isomerase [Bacteroidota bacterium]MBS1608158.1 FKBP-type peptidyl-prolyl cis-trans isomerase [Bacteroidota bacterium]
MKKILIGSLIAIVVYVSCSKSSSTGSQYPCNLNYDTCALKAPSNEIDTVEAYLTANNITGAVKHCSGMYYKIDSTGTGKSAGVCSTIIAKYSGVLSNGTVFQDQTTGQLPVSQLIAGFKNGILLIKEGGGITLYVPPTLAYGNQQVGSKIPPNSMLIFQVNLVSVQ